MVKRMKINKYHGKYNRSWRNGGVSAIKYICIHYTGGTGSAKNNCIYFSGGNRSASADYFIDNSGIWEYNDPSKGYYTWAVGDGKGKYGITNSNSISIEVVNNGGAFTAKEIEYLKELVPYLMKKYNIPAANVKRHYDASRKQCPAYYVNANRWKTLHVQITGASVPAATTTSKPTSTSISKIAVDGTWGPSTTKALQKQLGTVQDGIVSGQKTTLKKYWQNCSTSSWKFGNGGGSQMIKALQRKIGTGADGIAGKGTSKALQKYLNKKGKYGLTVDGYFGKNSVTAMQKAINAGYFK